MRKFSLFLAAFCLACVVPAFAGLTQPAEPAAHSPLPTPVLDQPHWRTFTSQEGGFSVLLPSAPTLKTLSLTASGEAIHECLSRDGANAYLIFYRDMPPSRVKLLGAEKILTISDNAELKITGSPLISKSLIMLNGSPGHETITSRRNGRIRLRHNYIIGNRFFTLDVLQPMSQKQGKPTDADKFLSSFALLPAKIPVRSR